MTHSSSPEAAPTLVWFREDLRLSDQPALTAAVARGAPLLCIYIFEEDSLRPLGAAARWYLHQSLVALAQGLARLGGRLDFYRGRADEIVTRVAESSGAGALYWTRRYNGEGIARDSALKSALAGRLDVRSFNGKLLIEPWDGLNASGAPYRVFTPFWRAAQARLDTAPPLPAPRALRAAAPAPGALPLEALDLLPRRPDWAGGLRARWRAGEIAARERLVDFIDSRLAAYAEARDLPARDATSLLSPALAFGEISPRQIRAAVSHAADAQPALQSASAKFMSEIGWREFSHALLFHFPTLPQANFDGRFDSFSWRPADDPQVAAEIAAWRAGRTGYPLVDAGMRELWATGYMHNRVRMAAASFLVKHLLVDWRVGEAWFWDTLCDADVANNAASWQWVAGSGADAAPYFRIFNPTLQGEKFDPDGAYVKRWIPELDALPATFVHRPWAAAHAPVDYPAPIVAHDFARKRALAAFAALKG